MTAVDAAMLDRIQRRVLWLAVRMVDYANHERRADDNLKVGGHQASSASLVTAMTALWFCYLRAEDRVSVKPHASPVLHAINYLLGTLDREYLAKLRSFGGLQAYPSRTKDPDPVDYSTGSVGLGAAAPLFGAATARYVEQRFNRSQPGRYISIVGDAELDEGNVWEAISDPATHGLGNVVWVVDLNRQSLDRVVPGVKAAQLERLFADSGWQVVEAKYGHRLKAAFRRPGGEALRAHLDAMSNEDYQALFTVGYGALRDRFLDGADAAVKRAIADIPDRDLGAVVQNLGGHDFDELDSGYHLAFAEVSRPTVIFAYTVKGWGLPIAGDPQNHAALLSTAQIDALRGHLDIDTSDEWSRFPADTPEGLLCAQVAARLVQAERPPHRQPPPIPTATRISTPRPLSTQEAFGRIMTSLARDDELLARLVTTSPDVTVSTNLGGWINRAGVFAPEQRGGPVGERALKWVEGPDGHHIELGISEMNLFLLLGQLGLSAEQCDELLLPVGTVYDPFVLRGLDAFIYSLYAGAKFIVVGTPSGVTLSYEGGAHQSIVTASVGVELPGVTFAEPAFAGALDWIFCDALNRLCDRANGESTYLRLTTRPLDQAPFESARARIGDAELRRQVLAGAYRLVEGQPGRGMPAVNLVASGAVMPEVLAAADALADEEVDARVIDVTSIDRLHRTWTTAIEAEIRTATIAPASGPLAELLSDDGTPIPIVTVHDASPHTMSWLGSAVGAVSAALGVASFGQSGGIADLYRVNDLAAPSIVNAALAVIQRGEHRATGGT